MNQSQTKEHRQLPNKTMETKTKNSTQDFTLRLVTELRAVVILRPSIFNRYFSLAKTYIKNTAQ